MRFYTSTCSRLFFPWKQWESVPKPQVDVRVQASTRNLRIQATLFLITVCKLLYSLSSWIYTQSNNICHEKIILTSHYSQIIQLLYSFWLRTTNHSGAFIFLSILFGFVEDLEKRILHNTFIGQYRTWIWKKRKWCAQETS